MLSWKYGAIFLVTYFPSMLPRNKTCLSGFFLVKRQRVCLNQLYFVPEPFFVARHKLGLVLSWKYGVIFSVIDRWGYAPSQTACLSCIFLINRQRACLNQLYFAPEPFFVARRKFGFSV